MANLLEEAYSRSIEIWSSDIVYTELQIAIRERFNGVADALNRIGPIVKGLTRQSLPKAEVLKELERSSLAGLELFFTAESIHLLSVDQLDETDTREVFRDYFNVRGCFSERKRAEFPDAFQAALIRRVVRTSEKVAVLTMDGDLDKAFKSVNQIKVFKSIQKLVEILRALPEPTDIDTEQN